MTLEPCPKYLNPCNMDLYIEAFDKHSVIEKIDAFFEAARNREEQVRPREDEDIIPFDMIYAEATGTRAKLEETADGKYLVFPNIKECTDARKRLKNAKFLDGYVRLEPMQHEYDVYTLSYIADEGPDYLVLPAVFFYLGIEKDIRIRYKGHYNTARIGKSYVSEARSVGGDTYIYTATTHRKKPRTLSGNIAR